MAGRAPKAERGAPAACPGCGEAGIECLGSRRVPNPKVTLTSLVRPEHRGEFPSGPVFFCVQRECDTVYFGAEGGQIKKDQLSVGVWQKEESRDIPVCYCFDYSARDIAEDAGRNSPPEIPHIIRGKIEAGECQCEIKNPQGACCLGNVAYWVKRGG